MRKLIQIAYEEIALHLRQGAFYLSLALTLAIFIAAGALPRLQEARQNNPLTTLGNETIFAESETLEVPTGYVDRAGIIQFVPPEQAERFFAFESETRAAEHLEAGLVDSYYVIPADFLETGEVRHVSPNPQLLASTDTAVQKILRENLVAALDRPGLAARLGTPVRMRWRGEPPPSFNFIPSTLDWERLGAAGLVAGLFAYVLNASGFLLLGALQRETNSRVLEMLITSTTPAELLGGKLLGLSVLAFMQVGVSLVAGLFVYTSAPDYIDTGALPAVVLLIGLPYLLLGYLSYGSLMIGLAAVFPNLGESMQLQLIVRLLFLAPLGGAIFILPNAASRTSVALTLFPITSPLLMPFRVLIADVPAWQVAVSLLVLVGWAGVLFWFSTRLFRANSLLTGRSPSPAALWQVLRE